MLACSLDAYSMSFNAQLRPAHDDANIAVFFKKTPGQMLEPKSNQTRCSQKNPLFQKPSTDVSVTSMKVKRTRRKQLVLPPNIPTLLQKYASVDQLEHVGVEIVSEPTPLESGYAAYSNRTEPSTTVSQLPTPYPNTLNGFVFIITGVLENMDRDQAAKYITECGGFVTLSVCKKITHALVGKDCGKSKIVKLKAANVPLISESGLLKLVALIRSENEIPSLQVVSITSTPEDGPGTRMQEDEIMD